VASKNRRGLTSQTILPETFGSSERSRRTTREGPLGIASCNGRSQPVAPLKESGSIPTWIREEPIRMTASWPAPETRLRTRTQRSSLLLGVGENSLRRQNTSQLPRQPFTWTGWTNRSFKNVRSRRTHMIPAPALLVQPMPWRAATQGGRAGLPVIAAYGQVSRRRRRRGVAMNPSTRA